MLVRNESLATVVRHLVPPRSIWEPNTTPNTPYSKRNTILPYSRIFHRSFRYVSAMKEQTSETKPHPFDSVKPTNWLTNQLTKKSTKQQTQATNGFRLLPIFIVTEEAARSTPVDYNYDSVDHPPPPPKKKSWIRAVRLRAPNIYAIM